MKQGQIIIVQQVRHRAAGFYDVIRKSPSIIKIIGQFHIGRKVGQIKLHVRLLFLSHGIPEFLKIEIIIS